MKSPFPGMDPYLEPSWGDIHTRLISSSSAALNKVLPDDLIARVEERVTLETIAGEEELADDSSVIPDARIFELASRNAKASATSATVMLAPFRLELLNEAATERFVEIIDVGERLVTVLEFISPGNKLSDGLKPFVDKRNRLLAAGVNVVEIDLVRAGNWRRLLGPYRVPANAVSAYRAVIRVPGERAEVYLHPIELRQSLPAVKVPLRPTAAPCELALQALVEDAYVAGRYRRTINYSRPCEPPLGDDDSAWADQLLRQTGRKP